MLQVRILIIFGLIVTIECMGRRLLSSGIIDDIIELKGNMVDWVAYPHSAYNRTELEIRLHCIDFETATYEYEVQYVLRSSPCDKEFFDAHRREQIRDLIEFYFNEKEFIPPNYHYDKIVWYKSPKITFKCKGGVDYFPMENPKKPMKAVNVKPKGATETIEATVEKRSVNIRKRQPNVNGNSIDGGAKSTLTSWNPTQTLPVDGIYLLVVQISIKRGKIPSDKNKAHNISLEVQWRGPQGYLSAIDYPLLSFYGVMCFLYAILALIWFIVSLKYWKDLLRIQFWIGAVILLGMVEKAVFYSEYQSVNASGTSVAGAMELAELTSCLKRTLARMLIIIVSVGFGVVKPRLGSTLHQVVGVGFIYFILCSIEGVARIGKFRTEAVKEKQLTALPLVLLEVGIFWWIFTSLVGTMRALRMRRNEVKLSLYRHFTNTLCFAILASVAFMFWSLYQHVFTDCLTDWKELWVDSAFWHVLFCTILIVIMILWRPSNNNQRYAFTPLLDNSEDENDDDEIFSSDAFVTEAMKLRQPSETKAENRKQRDPDQALQDELRWVDENIPSSVTDKLMADSDEEAEQTRFELSKIQ